MKILLFLLALVVPALGQTGGTLTANGSGVISGPVSGATFKSANGFTSGTVGANIALVY